MRDDETLDELLDKLRAQNDETLRIFADSRPRHAVPSRTMCRGSRRTCDFWIGALGGACI